MLTGMKINNISTAQAAMRRLHEMGAKTVVISSTELGSKDLLVQLASRINGKLFAQRWPFKYNRHEHNIKTVFA